MIALQETAFKAFETAKTCADVDRTVRDYYIKHDLLANWRHHTGHAIGLRYHEGLNAVGIRGGVAGNDFASSRL
jgi:Xaa-Pro aminopeptidase